MTPIHRRQSLLCWARCVAVAAILPGALAESLDAAQAQSLADQSHSLRLVPAEAAFYSANLRIKEQWDIFTGSNAYARLMQIPLIQSAKMYVEYQLQESPEPPIAMFREYMASDEGKEVLALLKEMVADEVFAYGSADLGDLIGYFFEINSINRSSQFEALASGQDPDQIVHRRMMEWLNAHKDQLNLPDAVIGFRVRDRERATKFLGFLEHDLKSLLADQAPELAARLKREQIAKRDFLTLRLDGSLLPWEEIRAQVSAMDTDEFEKWKTLASAKTMVVAIGVVDEFLVASIGDSTEHLEKLGQGRLMADSAPAARLAKHANQRIAGLSFINGAFLNKANSPQRSLTDMADMAVDLLKQSPITEEQRAKLGEDIRGFTAAVNKYLPQPGDLAMVSVLTPRGYEMFRYNHGTNPTADASRPLTVLNHVGGNPLLLYATHTADTVEDYNLGINWVTRLAADAEKIVETHVPPDDWAKYSQYRERGLELLRRIDRANREQIIPSMRANEQALVVDVASKSVQWFAPLPRSPEPLPMLEIGVVARVNDAELLRKGVSEYSAVIQEALKLMHEISPDEIPQLQIPAPETRSIAGGMVYTYPFPAEWGVDSQLALNAGLTDQVVALSMLPAFTEQLLKSAPIAIDTAVDLTRPAAVITHFQFAKVLDAVKPWIDYGVGVATGRIVADGAVADPDNAMQQAIMMQAGLIIPQVNQLLDVMKAVRSHTSLTYRENDVWVTHSELHLKDLE